ncbi:MAG: peptide chain release factor N(5)-glutamine methyltransferase [Planctomycetes bacterium]|nr:peptide chain release factor N(5)-glutamine methyltransferase [Planctomycetota bacterium]
MGRLLTWTGSYLREHHSESPRLDAEVLLAHALGCERIALYTRFDEIAGDAARASFRELVGRRAAGAPVAYLVGHKEFFSLDFEVGPDVLIPRPDSELVVLEFLRVAKPLQQVTAIDVGTGSGNLVVAAAHQHKGARFWAIDSSPGALAVARRNAECHGVLDRIEFLEGSLFGRLPSDLRVDCIVTNPPYIPTGELPNLPVGVRDYEPKMALDGGPTGLEVVGQIIAQASQHLKPGGQFVLEIGAPQESAVRKLMEERGEYELLPTIRDYAGHPRVVSSRLRSQGAVGQVS